MRHLRDLKRSYLTDTLSAHDERWIRRHRRRRTSVLAFHCVQLGLLTRQDLFFLCGSSSCRSLPPRSQRRRRNIDVSERTAGEKRRQDRHVACPGDAEGRRRMDSPPKAPTGAAWPRRFTRRVPRTGWSMPPFCKGGSSPACTAASRSRAEAARRGLRERGSSPPVLMGRSYASRPTPGCALNADEV